MIRCLDLESGNMPVWCAGVRALFNPTARCAKTLRVLDISECSGIKLSFLATLQADSALEVLRADSCNSLVSLNAKLPLSSALRELSVKRCSHLHTVELDAPALERLSVSNSTSLLGLSLTAPRLRQLYAVHCRNLQELFITEPPETSVLHEVNLEGCSSLPGGSMSALIAASPRLRLCNLMSCRQLAQLMVPGELNTMSCLVHVYIYTCLASLSLWCGVQSVCCWRS